MTLSSSPSPPPEVPPLQGTAGALVDSSKSKGAAATQVQGAVSSRLGGILALLAVPFLAAAARGAVARRAMLPPAGWSWAGAAARESPREAARLAIAAAAWVAAAAAALLLEGGGGDEATAQAQESAEIAARVSPPLVEIAARISPPLAEVGDKISPSFVEFDGEQLRIRMPTRPDRVVPLSRHLDAFKERNERVTSVDVRLRASAALAPCAGALASFLRELSFSADRECSCNLWDDDREEAPAWSPDKVEAALAMVQAYLGNPTVTGPRRVRVPAGSLCRELVDTIFRSASRRRPVNVYLSGNGSRAGNLYVESGDVELFAASGPGPALALLRLVLLAQQSAARGDVGNGGPPMPDKLHVVVDGSTLPAAVRALQDRRNHSFRELRFIASEDRLEGASLLAAAMLCPAARTLQFTDFSLVSWEPVVRPTAGGALEPLESLHLVHCSIGRGGPAGGTLGASPRSVASLRQRGCAPATGGAPIGRERDYRRRLPLEYTIDLLRTLSVLDVDLVGADLDPRGMSLLCGLLTGVGCRVRQLRLGPSPLSPGSRVTDDAVGLFFQRLPSMMSLKDLELHHEAPARLFETILSGVRRNRHLTSLRRLSFVPSVRGANRDRMRHIQFCVRANARSAVLESARHPNDPALRAAAVEAIVGLARPASRRRRRDLSVLAELVRDYVPAHAPALARAAAAAETNRPPPLPPAFLADAEP
jgi:hypothetical protein